VADAWYMHNYYQLAAASPCVTRAFHRHACMVSSEWYWPCLVYLAPPGQAEGQSDVLYKQHNSQLHVILTKGREP